MKTDELRRRRKAHEAAERHVREAFPPLACSSLLAAIYGVGFGGLLLVIAGVIDQNGPRDVSAAAALALAGLGPWGFVRFQERERDRAFAEVYRLNLSDDDDGEEEPAA